MFAMPLYHMQLPKTFFLFFFRSVAVVFALMSGDGLKTRSSIVMVKIVQSLYTKHATESSQFPLVRGIVVNVNRRSDQREFAASCVRHVTAL